MEIVYVGKKGQIVIPKQFRDELNIENGSRLIMEEKGKLITIRKVERDEDILWMLVSEETLKKTWDNPYDTRWDDVL